MKCVVIGAGINGLSTAIWLQRFGHDVTLVDRAEPGAGRLTAMRASWRQVRFCQ